jgi:hypothetical protein
VAELALDEEGITGTIKVSADHQRLSGESSDVTPALERPH